MRHFRHAVLRCSVCAIALLVLTSTHAWAHPRPSLRKAPAAYLGSFALGALGGFFAHESAHLSVNTALGNRPALRPIRGILGIPFVAISPDIYCTKSQCYGSRGQPFVYGHRGRAWIASAGFAMQWLTSEMILSHMPDVAYRREPFLQGWLALNILLALAYAVTCASGLENEFGDASGLAMHARMPPALTATLVATPALLDATRMLWPHQPWVRWAARASKLAFLGVVLWR